MPNCIHNLIYVESPSDCGSIERFEAELETRMSVLLEQGESLQGENLLPLLFFGNTADKIDLETLTGTKWFWLAQESPFTVKNNMLEIRSAWGPCYMFSKYLAERLCHLDPNVVVVHEWEDMDDRWHRGEAEFVVRNGEAMIKEGHVNSNIAEDTFGKSISIFEDEDEYECALEDGDVADNIRPIYVRDIEKLVSERFHKSKLRKV